MCAHKEVISRGFPLLAIAQVFVVKMPGFKSCLCSGAGRCDAKANFAVLFLVLNFNLTLFQPYLHHVVHFQSTERAGSLG